MDDIAHCSIVGYVHANFLINPAEFTDRVNQIDYERDSKTPVQAPEGLNWCLSLATS